MGSLLGKLTFSSPSTHASRIPPKKSPYEVNQNGTTLHQPHREPLNQRHREANRAPPPPARETPITSMAKRPGIQSIQASVPSPQTQRPTPPPWNVPEHRSRQSNSL